MNLEFDKKMPKYREQIENWRVQMLDQKGAKLLKHGFWSGRKTLENPEDDALKTIRILVCGNTGVGKSTLINKIFGVGDELVS